MQIPVKGFFIRFKTIELDEKKSENDRKSYNKISVGRCSFFYHNVREKIIRPRKVPKLFKKEAYIQPLSL